MRELVIHEYVTSSLAGSMPINDNANSPVSIQDAINRAVKECRYLLIDVYNPNLPSSYTFSQKVWSNTKVVNLMLLNFVFAQVITTSEEGLAYQNAFPNANNSEPPTTHFALLNPFTRQRTFYWNDLREPEEVFRVYTTTASKTSE
ncbi:unnamed protein product [Hymenolepis diminuta]|nr:unnamed protein product [Hymenolepis diminuta]